MAFKSLAPACSLLATALTSAFASMSLLAQEHQTSSPPGTTPSSNQSTNSTQSSSGKADGLKNLEQSIFKPFRGFEPDGSLDGVMSRPQRPPAVSDKRVKELIERRKN